MGCSEDESPMRKINASVAASHRREVFYAATDLRMLCDHPFRRKT